MIECADAAACQAIAEQLKNIVTTAVVGSVGLVVIGQVARSVWKQKRESKSNNT